MNEKEKEDKQDYPTDNSIQERGAEVESDEEVAAGREESRSAMKPTPLHPRPGVPSDGKPEKAGKEQGDDDMGGYGGNEGQY